MSCIAKLLAIMEEIKIKEDLSDKLRIAFDKAREQFIAEEKARNGYVVVSDKNGNIKRIPAKDFK